MLWPLPLTVLAAAVSPLGAAAGDITTYVLGFGPIGIGCVLFALRIIVPGKALDAARAEARADLLDEKNRLVADLAKVQELRETELRYMRENVVPLLSEFTSATSTLIPILQRVVSDREDGRGTEHGRR